MADTILSLLEPGEYVLNRNAVDKIGKKALDKINYKEAPRFPNKSILSDYLGQQETPNFWTGMINSLMQDSPKKALGSPSRSSIPVPVDEEGMLSNDIEQQNIPQMSLDDAIWEGTDEDFARALGVEGYQDGGSVSYGGYESEQPTLNSLYEMFGVMPNKKNEDRFQEYDPSREGVHYEDYDTALDKSKTAGTRGLEQLYAETAGLGGFAGAGAAEKARGRGRKSLMEDYLSAQKSSSSSLFKSVRDEREKWMREMGGQLSDLERAEGTRRYMGDDEDPTDPTVYEDVGGWNPPANPTTGQEYMANDGNSYTYHHRDGWMLSEDFRASYDFGSQQGAGGP